ncbi:hypothetical protein C6P40_002057 [Pichia californica]|uniref:Uncharacterized protein n=1 Tax=Pichia californica TaxID=460514 RepID=A0A9P6WL08_9ASCO|nr:hypothetical protein C6P42_001819 [[Candida] californica]KAG0687653.1 hypothetical protein C6P40_002057 [[Candida] californica]
MKLDFTLLAIVPLLIQISQAAYLGATIPPKTTFIDTQQQAFQTDLPTHTDFLVKRNAEADAKKAIVNKDWLKAESERIYGKEEVLPKPWLRTIYGTIHEVVTPYVVGSITFAGPEAEETNSLKPWISIKKDGLPKTITPKLKNNVVVDGFPEVKTFFQTATTVTHHQKDLKAHNMKEDDTIEEVLMIDEDDTYIKLSPIQRCTPDYYYRKGVANVEISEPFCSPRDHQRMRVGATYFITWYSRFFKNVENVKFHYAYVNEKSHDKGFDKRDLIDLAIKKNDAEIIPQTGNIDFQGDVYGAFHSSEWVSNHNGWFPVDIDKKWLKGSVYKKVVIAMQADNVSDEDFSILDAPHFFATFQLRESIGKNTKEMRKLQDAAGTNDDVYYVIAAVPTCVMISVLFMYGFLYLNRKHRDLSHIRKPKKSRFGNVGKYNIPVALTDIKKPKKQL